MKKIEHWLWFSGGTGSVGVVLTTRSDYKKRAYIGISAGLDEVNDSVRIADYGAKLTFTQALGFFPDLIEDQYAKD